MKDILFVTTPLKKELRGETNGTLILATKLMEAGFSVDVLRFYQFDNYKKANYSAFIDAITEKILSEAPKCVSFYTLWPFYHILLRISQRLKERNPHIIIIMGGPQASATAYDTMTAMPFVDYIATGEGENTVVPFFTCLLQNNCRGIEEIPGLYYRKNGQVEFCHTPVPLCDINAVPRWHDCFYETDEQNLDKRDYYMPIDVGRGCPFGCTFCCSSIFWQRKYRLKNPDKILEDMLFFNQKFGIRSFMFAHDAFTMNKQLIFDLCDRLIDKKLDFNWKCTTRADCLTEDLILKMKAAGMDRIEIGVETGSPRMQKIINKKLNLEKVKQTVQFLIKNHIHTTLFFMHAFPEETEEDLQQTLQMQFDFIEMGVARAGTSYCAFNPTTHITQQYLDELVFSPENNKIISRDILGYGEELEMIKNNKAIFPFYYHLHTPVRDNYQYLFYFSFFYNTFTNCMKFLRNYYKNDLLRFYQDFYNNNRDIFDSNMSIIQKNFGDNYRQMIINTIKHCDKAIIDHFSALLDFQIDFRRVSKSKTDISMQRVYHFNYIEYQLQLPIEQFSDSSCELLIEKKNGAVSVQIISI